MDNTDKLIDDFIGDMREAENLLLESNTEMENYSDKEREEFYEKGIKLKEKAEETYNFLVNKRGVDEEYLNELMMNLGI